MAYAFDTTRTTAIAAVVPAGNTNFATLKTAANTFGTSWATYCNAEAAVTTPTYQEGEDRICRALEFMATESVDKST